MKIEETKNGNIKLVMSTWETRALYRLLDQLEHDEIYSKFGPGNANQAEHIIDIWECLCDTKHLYV